MARHVWAGAVWLVTLLVSSGVALTQTAAGPSGHWEGAIQVPGQPINVEIDLSGAGEKWEGTIAIPAQGLKAFPLAAITIQADAVSFAMRGVPGEPQFKGTLSKDAKVLSGDFSQGGASLPFSLTLTGDARIERPPKSTPITRELEGTWEGALDVNGNALRLVLTLASQADGLATGTLVSVDQGGAEVPIAAVVQNGGHLKLVVPAVVGNYDGDLIDGQLTGTWTQGPRSWPLVLKRTK